MSDRVPPRPLLPGLLRGCGLAIASLLLLGYLLAPVLWLVSSSLQTEREIVSVPPHWIPEHPTLHNFRAILAAVPGLSSAPAPPQGDPTAGGFIPSTAGNLLPAMLNSLIVAAVVVVLNLLVGVPAAYAIAKIRFRGRNLALYTVLATRVIPDIALVVPFFLVVRKLGLLDSLASLIVTYLAITVPFSVFVLASTFEQLPDDLDRAARVDGCSRLQVLLRVFLPLARPALVAVGLFAFLASWNEFLLALMFTQTAASQTLPIIVASFTSDFTVSFSFLNAAGVLAVLPPAILAVIFERSIVSGLTAGAVKADRMARIRFQSVSKRYANGHAAVNDLTLDIADREFVVLLGPSGCGKSTTLNMIAGLEEITTGALLFDDEVMNHQPAHRRDVAMVFQSYALYPHKSVFENIAFGLRMRRVPDAEVRRRVSDAAERLEITHLLQRRPSQLSGGQRQRVALGRAMVRQPAVFLMDEPLSNLDASLRISMRAQIRHLHSEMRTTFVYVTHDQAEALTLADRIVVMRDGVIQQLGTPHDIYERPRTMFVASFLGSPAINFLEGELATQGGLPCFRRGALTIVLPAELAASIDGRGAGAVMLGLRAEDVGAVEPGRPTLVGVVDTAMPTGADQFLGLKVAGSDVFVRVGKDVAVNEGEVITLGLNPARLHLFDKASGESLLHGPAR